MCSAEVSLGVGVEPSAVTDSVSSVGMDFDSLGGIDLSVPEAAGCETSAGIDS